MNWMLRTFEIGYWIRKSGEGQGYVTETVQVLTRLAFDHPQANRVEIRVDPANVRSRHVFALIPEEYCRLDWSK